MSAPRCYNIDIYPSILVCLSLSGLLEPIPAVIGQGTPWTGHQNKEEVSYRTLQWGWGGWRWRGASNSSSPASVLPSPCKILLTWHCDTVQLETCGHGSPQTFSQFLHRFRHSPVMFSPCSHGSGSLTRIWIWSWIVSSLSDFVCYRFLCSLLWFPQLCPRVCLCPVSVVSQQQPKQNLNF